MKRDARKMRNAPTPRLPQFRSRLSTWSAIFLWACILSCQSIRAQNTDDTNSAFTSNGVLDPSELAIFENADFEAFLSGLDTTFVGLNATVVARVCGVEGFQSVNEESCNYEDSTGFEAGISLMCGPADGDVSDETFVTSDVVGGTQTLILTRDGVFSTDSKAMRCVINSKSYNSGPIVYEFSVTALESLPTLVEEQQRALDAVYQGCCSEEGSCSPWRVDANSSVELTRRRSRNLLQADGPAPEPIAEVPGTDLNEIAAPAPAPGQDASLAAEPSSESLAPSTDITLSSGVYTDFCKVSGNVCSGDGLLTTLDLHAYDLRCDVSVLASLLKDIPTLENLILSENPSLTGPLDVALDEFAIAKGNDSETLSEYSWKNIHIDNTSISGEFSLETDDDAAPICSLIQSGLLQLSLENTGVSGSLQPCMFDAESSSLQILQASKTSVSSLTSSFSEAQSLRSLKIQNASLSGSVDALPRFMAEFQVSNNNLTGNLPAAQDSTALYDVSNNMFDGAIPDQFVDHPALRLVSFSQNQLTDIPSDWISTTSRPSNNPPLKYVYLSLNPLKKQFPAGFAFYQNITGLYASNTEMNGPLPELADEAFPSLLTLEVQNNQISGTVPDSWEGTKLFERASELTRFGNFSTNNMTGALPAWLGEEILNAEYDFSGNNFSNGCDEEFLSLQTCSEASSNATAPASEPSPDGEAPSPAETDEAKGSEEDSGGSSTGLIVATVIVCLIILGFGGYFMYKKYKARRDEGTFTRFEDSGVQMTSNQAYTAYNPSLDP